MSGSVWVRLDAGYLSNPKIKRAGVDAALLHLAAIGYLGQHQDPIGIVPAETVDDLVRLVKLKRPAATIALLVKHGLWHERDAGDYLVHDWETTNGQRSEGWQARERKRAQRARSNGEPLPGLGPR